MVCIEIVLSHLILTANLLMPVILLSTRADSTTASKRRIAQLARSHHNKTYAIKCFALLSLQHVKKWAQHSVEEEGIV